MSFRLWTIFYVFALVAAALATFGAWGILAAAVVLGIWASTIGSPRRKATPLQLQVAVLIFGTLVALLLPAIGSARRAAQRNLCMSNLKEIMLAMLNYESVNRAFPPAYVTDATGKPMHSWRVLILPYLGQQALFNAYKMSEPWDGPNNSKLAVLTPGQYFCPTHSLDARSRSAECNYFAVVGPETGLLATVGRPIRNFSDGTSKTLMVIEASGLGINWMEPRDVTLNEAVELLTTKPRSGHMHVEDGFVTKTYYETSSRNVAFCDGHLEWIRQLQDADVARALLTVAGGETLPDEFDEIYVKEVSRTVIKWEVVWSLTVFVCLSLLPAAWRLRDGHEREKADAQVGVS